MPCIHQTLFVSNDNIQADPLAHADPDTKLPAAERPIGGLGILMVKKMADSISYERARNRNFLTVFKNGMPKIAKNDMP